MAHSLNLFVLIASLSLLSNPVSTVERVKVMALFPGQAMISIDGRNRLLKAGQTSPEGVRLISASPHEAVIEVEGERRNLALGSSVQSAYQKRAVKEVTIWRDNNGAYNTIGSINGQNVEMLVDTGATSVAMDEGTARGLGLQYRLKGEKTAVRTASGIAKAYIVMLDRVQVGGLSLHNVEGFVIQGKGPHRVLLGMSFLNRVEMRNQGDMLILRSKF